MYTHTGILKSPAVYAYKYRKSWKPSCRALQKNQHPTTGEVLLLFHTHTHTHTHKHTHTHMYVYTYRNSEKPSCICIIIQEFSKAQLQSTTKESTRNYWRSASAISQYLPCPRCPQYVCPIWMSHESCNRYECAKIYSTYIHKLRVMSHIWMSHGSCHWYEWNMTHVIDMNETCAMSRIWMSPSSCVPYAWVRSHITYKNDFVLIRWTNEFVNVKWLTLSPQRTLSASISPSQRVIKWEANMSCNYYERIQ